MARTLILIICLFVVKSSFAQKNTERLYVFVGERISVHEFKQKEDPPTIDPKTGDTLRTIIFDASFKAKYKVIKNVFNKYDKDTIEFEAYDHYGKPMFSRYKYVLLFVYKVGDKYYHSKYLFYEVYPTRNGRWASACEPRSTMWHDDFEKSRAKAVPIQFSKKVSFKIRKVQPSLRGLLTEPYFTIKHDKAIALMGTYVDDLFKIEADGNLKARGWEF